MSKKKNAKNKKSVKTVDAVEKPGVVEAWALAARPKTLAAACSPVIVGLGLAYRDIADGRAVSDVFVLVPALCCLAFALLAQVAANFINDYADFKKGADGGERKGPRRAVANGWISPRAMLTGTFVALAVACLFGLVTLLYVAPEHRATLVGIGAVCCVFCLLYSAGPLPLAYIGLGDVLVVAFFGVVAVCFTYFVQTLTFTLDSALLGTAIGFATDNILVSNNYRDRDEDRAAGKFTLIAVFGERFGRYFYLVNGLIVIALVAAIYVRREWWDPVGVGALVVYLALHLRAWRILARIRSGAGLVRALALSSANLLILSVMLAFAFVF
ncbi:MAG: 1,4-dihydroxy-2-naphthoate octaprenyltransferase [Thermoguttaceae bacterium]|nr:1,4-dihydroxy-2-naphthoate octaprenyltransferase [Thermoguttaceae bacterium]